MRTVELLPDETLAATVQGVWRLLTGTALPSPAQHSHPSNRPHVTVAVVDDWDADTTKLLRQAVTGLPVPLHVEGLKTFGQRRLTLVASIALEPELIAVHEAVHAVLEANAWGLEEQHLPGRWVPHLTLARGLDRAQESAARTMIGDMGWPRGYATGARTYDRTDRSIGVLA